MSKKHILLILCVTAIGIFFLVFLFGGKTMNIDTDNVEKIEVQSMSHLIGEYTELSEITAVANFLNSFTLTERYEIIDCQRVSTEFTIYYKDGNTEYIEYRYTSLVYRGKGYRIDSDRSVELDSLLFPNLNR